MLCYLTDTVDAYNTTRDTIEKIEKGQQLRIISVTPKKVVFLRAGVFYEVDSNKLFCR